MRAVLVIGVLVFVAGCVSTSEAISFDDLEKAADAVDHPQPVNKAKPKKIDPEMQQWSTEHLLGLDQKVPKHMFDDLVRPKKSRQGCSKKGPPEGQGRQG